MFRLLHTNRALFLLGLALFLPKVDALAQAGGGGRTPERAGSLTYTDPRLGGKVPPREWQIYVARENIAGKDYGPNTDPKYNVTYPGKLQVMCSTEEEGRNPERAFVIHFMKPEDEALARRVGAMMGRLYWLGVDYLGVAPAPGRYVNVWLARHGEPGAEELQKNIYLYAIDKDRTPAEWVRELAHEYAHIFVPPVGEYTAPEKWANGYLGERLFMKWLLHDNGQNQVWTQPIDAAAFMAKEVLPLRNRYLAVGPAAPVGEKNDAEGMDYFIGQMLAIEAAHGPVVMKRLMARYATPRAQSLGRYLSQALSDLQPAEFPLDPRMFIPDASQVETSPNAPPKLKKAAYWFYLPGGTWHIKLTGDLPAGLTLVLEGSTLKHLGGVAGMQAWETSMPGAVGSWRRMEIAAPASQSASVQTITLTRKEG
jgi:hypothetical protein